MSPGDLGNYGIQGDVVPNSFSCKVHMHGRADLSGARLRGVDLAHLPRILWLLQWTSYLESPLF